GAQFLLEDVLVGLHAAAASSPPGAAGPLERALRTGWQLSPEFVRRPIRSIRDRVHLRGRSQAPTLPPHARDGRCFPLDNGLAVGGIRLNLAGREPAGLLSPGSAREFCESLTHDLLEIVDADSGHKVVERVIRTADLFRGEYLHHLPDLLVAWSDARPLGSMTTGNGRGAHGRLSSRQIGTVPGKNRYCRRGSHRRGGLCVGIS